MLISKMEKIVALPNQGPVSEKVDEISSSIVKVE
jgi:hypothetical protein